MKPLTTQGALGQPVPWKYQPTITPSAFIPDATVWKAPGTSNRVNVYERFAPPRAKPGDIAVLLNTFSAGATGLSEHAVMVMIAANAAGMNRWGFMVDLAKERVAINLSFYAGTHSRLTRRTSLPMIGWSPQKN